MERPTTYNHTDPLISIGMPALNCERTIALAISSVLDQSYGNWELLVVDDGSQDRTVQIVSRFSDPRIRLLADGRHQGLPKRLNQAIQASGGRYFARMDGDDICYPQRLERQLRFLQAHPDVDLVGSAVLVFKGEGHALGFRPYRSSHEQICRTPWSNFHIAHPTWLGKLGWFRTHRYREDAVRMEDQELLLRTWRTSRFAGLPEILLGYREESLALRRIVLGRLNYCKALLRQAQHVRGSYFAIRGALSHGAKTTVDTVAVLSGLRYHLLRHRARPLTSEMAHRWEQVWAQVRQRNSLEFAAVPDLSSEPEQTSG
jgi:glycosyltransferase involved in cell wall biosynthesis